MEYFELKKEDMAKAKTYMPLAQKVVLAETIARMCLKPIKPLNAKTIVDDFLIVPSVVGEDICKKEQMLLNVLLSHYFDIKIEQMDNKLYDKYMGKQILNQLERYKADSEYKLKAFDILADFKTVKKMVETEIYNLKTKENDVLERFMKGVSLFSAEKMTNDPDYRNKITEELKKVIDTAKSQATVAENATVETEE